MKSVSKFILIGMGTLMLCLYITSAMPESACIRLNPDDRIFSGLQKAIENVRANETAELLITGQVVEQEPVVLRGLHLTIRLVEGGSLQMLGGIQAYEGTTLILDGNMEILGQILCEDSELRLCRGVEVYASDTAVRIRNGSGTFESCHCEGKVGIDLEASDAVFLGGEYRGEPALMAVRSKIETIEDGTFLSQDREAVYLAHSWIGTIQNGRFEKMADTGALSRGAFYMDHESCIERIEGGIFRAASGSGLLMIRGACIREISGGTFQSLTDAVNQPFCHHALFILAGSDGFRTGVKTISGGTFESAGRTDAAALCAYCNAQGEVYIGEITGTACFSGSSGLLVGSTHSQGKARIERIDGGTFLSDCAATATAESALLVSTGVVENITAGTFLGNGTAPAIGLSRYCETDTGEMGEGGRIQEISGGDMIASGTAPALYCAAQGSGVTLISGGFFYGDSAVLIDNDEDLVITGGVFYATDRVCIQIAKGRSARLYLEPQYTTFSASPSAKGRARYMVRNYLTEGVENKYLFEADKEEQIVFPIWGQIDGDKEVKPYDLSGQGVALEEGNALVADSMFRYLTPSP